METEYTGGEWKVKSSPEYHEPKSSTIEIHSKRSQGWIAKIQNKGVIRQKEGLANAKLIAAAPDMFKSIVKLQEWSKKYPPGRVYSYGEAATIEKQLTEIIEEQLKAIQKAVGSDFF